jgi:DNA polymerase-3 subunit epsilon
VRRFCGPDRVEPQAELAAVVRSRQTIALSAARDAKEAPIPAMLSSANGQMREVILDTETTGLDVSQGHRIVEVACLELFHHVPTGRKWQRYINPQRDIPQDAFAVHGLTTEFLSTCPPFSEIADELLTFIGTDLLVSHNAEFDLAFLNAELSRSDRSPISDNWIDTLALARQRFPGAPASLDALCRRFGVDLSGRARHGAAVDCELLASVYLELLGGRQPGLDLAKPGTVAVATVRVVRQARPHVPSAAELAAHSAMLELLAAPLWLAET